MSLEKTGTPTQAVACFLVNEGNVLLAQKKQKIGVHKWNGYGGLQEEGDASIEDTVVREIKEETNGLVHIDKARLTKIAEILYHNYTKDLRRKDILVHFFTYMWSENLPEENEEMGVPSWFRFDEIPYHDMLPTDKEWMPQAFIEKLFIKGEVFHDPHGGVEKSSFTTDQ